MQDLYAKSGKCHLCSIAWKYWFVRDINRFGLFEQPPGILFEENTMV